MITKRGTEMKRNVESNEHLPGKNRVTISMSNDVKCKLEKIGQQYGLKLSDMVERAARYYIEEMEDLEIAQYRYTHPEGERISGEEVKRMFGGEG